MTRTPKDAAPAGAPSTEAAAPLAGRLQSVAEATAAGKAARSQAGRSRLAELPLWDRDPMAILAGQDTSRLPELVPLRRERMSASVFTFYRGTAAIMAADLARSPSSGIRVASCGDAHISNFGFYASPQRTLLFDLNDFDESAWAPWEWDLKRLATSVILAGQSTGRDATVVDAAARGSITAYLHATRRAAALDPVTRYFTHYDPDSALATLDKTSRRMLKSALRSARKRTGARAARRLTEHTDAGVERFIEHPPAMVHPGPEVGALVSNALDGYKRSANVDVRMLLNQYEVVDIARRAVGVGSVGTRCYIALLRDGDGNSLVMQIKQAGRSVLEEHGQVTQPAEVREVVADGGEGARVVGMQRILQTYSDPFLGYFSGETADYYVRQFHDMKGGIDAAELEDAPFAQYAAACAVVLARAHGQSGQDAKIAGYVGSGKRVTTAILDWCYAYADLAGGDFETFVSAT